jgi:trehalose 6-phosphate synthase
MKKAGRKAGKSGRLVAVSNRVGPVKGAAAAGGLAVGLVEALTERGGLWFGWSGKTAGSAHSRVRTEQIDDITLATLDLGQSDFDGHYNGFSNNCLWPLLHFRIDLMRFERRDFETYRRVNRSFAQSLSKLLRPDDLVWVHDFQLMPFGEELRRLRVRQRIGFFLHTPFPPTEILATLPANEELTRALFAYDLVGFQTQDDLERFCDHIEHSFRGTSRGNTVTAFGRQIRVGAFPIGIDVDQFSRYAFTPPGSREFARMRRVLRGRDQFIGVDRLDYSKGLLRRMDAFGRYLEGHPEAHGKVILLQVAPVSRGSIESYRNFRQELDREAARVNGRFARFDWTPVHYLNRALPRRTLAGLYRASRVGIVTPMRDGMNLVAMEYVAAQDPANPGVLLLSRFAGAAKYLRDALLVNPYDGDETAAAMHRAREMRIQERRRRHEALMRTLRARDIGRWHRSFLAALADAPAFGRGTRKAR